MRRRVPTTLALVFLLILSVGSSSDRCGDGVTAFIIALEPASSCASATRERAAEHGFDVRWHAGVRVGAETSWCAGLARARGACLRLPLEFTRARLCLGRAGRRPRARST